MFAKLRETFSTGSGGPVEYLVAGLGNPGKKYENTRHNVGFLAVEQLARDCGVRIERMKFKALTAVAQVDGHRVLLMKPTTFMNNSGEAVREAADFYKIPPERVLVLFDDVSLDVGRLRIRRQGSDGGHNGIKSIRAHLDSEQFPRIKIGVGQKPHPDYDLADWVLGRFPKEQQPTLARAIEAAVGAAGLIVQGQIDLAMNKFNS